MTRFRKVPKYRNRKLRFQIPNTDIAGTKKMPNPNSGRFLYSRFRKHVHKPQFLSTCMYLHHDIISHGMGCDVIISRLCLLVTTSEPLLHSNSGFMNRPTALYYLWSGKKLPPGLPPPPPQHTHTQESVATFLVVPNSQSKAK